MAILKVLRLMVRPKKLFAYLRLRQERKDRYLTLRRVTHLESAQRLHDKIRILNQQMADLLQ